MTGKYYISEEHRLDLEYWAGKINDAETNKIGSDRLNVLKDAWLMVDKYLDKVLAAQLPKPK